LITKVTNPTWRAGGLGDRLLQGSLEIEGIDLGVTKQLTVAEQLVWIGLGIHQTFADQHLPTAFLLFIQEGP
jgi:hypothetical protein